ncbi:glycine receptor subunit alpha-2-like [Tubulanus polymorphus]|uniref:glycine receptor subunit alpha-2-like n=1 Tax=Tubulanus polymorphus TaxID=672921 RepID=UPI003DA53C10
MLLGDVQILWATFRVGFLWILWIMFQTRSGFAFTFREHVDYVMNSTYDRRSHPLEAEGGIVVVKINLHVNEISSVNDFSMDYRMSFYLRQRWNDPRLSSNNFHNSNVLVLRYPDYTKLWLTDLFFTNEKKSSFHEVTSHNSYTKVYPDGNILFSQRLSATLSCPMCLTNFPFDSQTCNVSMESYSYTMDSLRFNWVENKNEHVILSKNLQLPEYKIRSVTSSVCDTHLDTGNFTCLRASFSLVREFGYYLIQWYIPTVLIVSLSWISFWIDVSASPARISLGLLTILAVTTHSAGSRSQLPRVSYIKANDVWTSSCMVFVFGALMEFALANLLARREFKYRRAASLRVKHQTAISDADGKSSKRYQNGDISVISSAQQNNHDTNIEQTAPPGDHHGIVHPPCACIAFGVTAKRVDVVSRYLFPFLFLIFNVAFWLYYYKPSCSKCHVADSSKSCSTSAML